MQPVMARSSPERRDRPVPLDQSREQGELRAPPRRDRAANAGERSSEAAVPVSLTSSTSSSAARSSSAAGPYRIRFARVESARTERPRSARNRRSHPRRATRACRRGTGQARRRSLQQFPPKSGVPFCELGTTSRSASSSASSLPCATCSRISEAGRSRSSSETRTAGASGVASIVVVDLVLSNEAGSDSRARRLPLTSRA